MNSAPTWQGVTIPNPLRLFVILPEKYLTGLLAGGAFAPYELFAAGKTSAQGEFISPKRLKATGSPQTLCVCGADDKQLDELSLNVTRREETSDEE